MKIRHYRNGKEVGSVAGITVKADSVIKAVITAIEERNNNELRRIKKGE